MIIISKKEQQTHIFEPQTLEEFQAIVETEIPNNDVSFLAGKSETDSVFTVKKA